MDFDDSAQTFLAYELRAICGNFAKDDRRRFDHSRIADLVAAYDSARPLTLRERQFLPDFLTIGVAAEGIGVLTSWLHKGQEVNATDSYSANAFLQLAGQRTALQAAIGTNR